MSESRATRDARRREVIEVTIPRAEFLGLALDHAGRIAVPTTAVTGFSVTEDDDGSLHCLLAVETTKSTKATKKHGADHQ
jgi:hypothetical protein